MRTIGPDIKGYLNVLQMEYGVPFEA